MTAQTPQRLGCVEARDHLPAYALGILDSDEEDNVRGHLATCPDCPRELVRFDGVVDAIASAPEAAPPPPNLRARLLKDIRAADDAPNQSDVSPMPDRVAPPAIIAIPRWAAWPLAAAAALLVAGVTVLAVLFAGAREERDDARTASSYLAAYLSAGGRVIKLSDATGKGDYYGHGSVVTAPEMSPLVVVGGCSPTTDKRVYRVWVARGDNRTRVGELQVSGDGKGWLEIELAESLETFDAIGITMVMEGD